MGELGGFLRIEKHNFEYSDPAQRVAHVKEFIEPLTSAEVSQQGGRCMDCGVPFCHNGCPLGNLIPDWNDLVYRDRWQDAIAQLHATNNFPEFTGRLCPAPCEAACTMEINEGEHVTIKQIEYAIGNRGWDEGWIVPEIPEHETGHRIAVVGAGPAGMAAAQQLRRMGHSVTLFERDEAAGGLMRFGVPDFKIEKTVIERRMQQLLDEGVELRVGIDVGTDVTVEELREEFGAVILATGSRVPRDLPVPGRELEGVHFALEFLYERNRRVSRVDGPVPQGEIPADSGITAKGKKVVVIGGGDTGADCVANSLREGATEVVQLELLPEPPAGRPDDRTPWPLWPAKYRKSYAKEELDALHKGEQDFSVITTSFEGENGQVKRLKVSRAADAPPFAPVEGTEFEIEADLVLLAMGFLHPEQELLDELGVAKDARGNVKSVRPYTSSVEGVFAAGDCRRGQSLIVWAINEGRRAAAMADRYVGGHAKDRADALTAH